MSRSSPVLSEIKRAVSKARTETAQRAAVIKALAAHGLHATPEIRETKAPDRKGKQRVVRLYLFRVPGIGAKVAGIALITGPGVTHADVRAMKAGMLTKPIRVAGGGVAKPTSVRSNPTPQLTVKRKYALPILEGAAARLRALGFFVTLHAEKGMDDLGITVYRDQDSSRYAALTVWLMDGDWHVSVGDSMGHSSKGWRVNVQNAQDAADALTQALRDAHIYAPDPRLQRNPAVPWTRGQLFEFLRTAPDGITVKELVYGFGGAHQAHKEALEQLVAEGVLVTEPWATGGRHYKLAGGPRFGTGARVSMKPDHWTGRGSQTGTVTHDSSSHRTLVRFDDGVLIDVETRALMPLQGNPAVPPHTHVWADKWVNEWGPPHVEKRCTICGLTPVQVQDQADPYTVVHQALAAYGATLTPGHLIRKGDKTLSVRVKVTGGKRPKIVFESSDRGTPIESGPVSAATVKRFVEGFWHWTPTRSNTGGGRAELEGLRQRYQQLQRYMGRSFTKQWEANERAKAKTKARIEALAAQLGTHPWIDEGPAHRRNPLDDGTYMGFGMTEDELEAAEAAESEMAPARTALTLHRGGMDRAEKERRQDELDALFQERIVEVRNILRNVFNWHDDEENGPLALTKRSATRGSHNINVKIEHAGAGRNVVGVTWVIDGGAREIPDEQGLTPEGLAAIVDSEAGASRGPAPVASSHGIPTPGSDQRRLVPGVWLYFTSPHGAKVGRIVAEPDLSRNQIRVHWVGDAEPKWDYYPQIKHDVEEVASGRPPSAGIHFEYFADKFGPNSDHEAIIDQFAQRAAARTAESVAAIAAHEARQEQQTQDVGPYYADLVKECVVLDARPPGADKNAYFSSYGLADTTDAKIIRQILNEAVGIKVSVTVRRYSMASGLNFAPPKGHGEWSDAEAEKIAKVFPTLVRTANYGPQHESHGKHHYRVDDSVYPDAREDKSDLQSDYHSPGGFRVAHAYVDLAKKIIARGAQDEGRVLSSAGMGALVSRTKRTKSGYAAPMPDHSAASGEADREIAIEAAQGRGPSIELYHSEDEGTVARGNTKPYKEILKAHRFRWYKAGGFWYIPRSRGRTTSPINIGAVAEALYEAGATVTEHGASRPPDSSFAPSGPMGREAYEEEQSARADEREEQWRTELTPLRYNVDQLGKMVNAAIEFGDEQEYQNALATLATIDEQAKRFAEVTGAKFDDPEFAPLLDRANILEAQLKEKFTPPDVPTSEEIGAEQTKDELYNGSAFISGEMDELREKARDFTASPTEEGLREVERKAGAVKTYIQEWYKKYEQFSIDGHVGSTIMEWGRDMDRSLEEIESIDNNANHTWRKALENRFVSEQDDKVRASIMWAQGNLAIALNKWEKAIERVERGEMSTASTKGVDFDVTDANRQEDRAWNAYPSFYAKDLSDTMDALAARRQALEQRRIAAEEGLKTRQEATRRGEITTGAQSDLARLKNMQIRGGLVPATAAEDAEILALKTGSYGNNRKVAIPIVGESLIFAVGDGYNDNRYTTAKLSPVVWRGAERPEAEAFGFNPTETPLQNLTSVVNWVAPFTHGEVVAFLHSDLWPALAANMSDDTNRYGLQGVAVARTGVGTVKTKAWPRTVFPPAVRIGAHNYAIPPVMLFSTDGSSLFSVFSDAEMADIAQPTAMPSIPGDLVWDLAAKKGNQPILIQSQSGGTKWGFITDRALSDHNEQPPPAGEIIAPLLNAANKDALYIDLTAKDIKAFLSLKLKTQIKGKENKQFAVLIWTSKGCAVRLGNLGAPWVKLPMLGHLRDWKVGQIGFNPMLVIRALTAIEKGADCSIVFSGETAIDPVLVLQGEKNGQNLRSLSVIMPMRIGNDDFADMPGGDHGGSHSDTLKRDDIKLNRRRRRNVGLLQPGSHGLDSRTRQVLFADPGPHEGLGRIHKAQQSYMNELRMDGASPNWAKAQQDLTIELGPPPVHRRNPWAHEMDDAWSSWRVADGPNAGFEFPARDERAAIRYVRERGLGTSVQPAIQLRTLANPRAPKKPVPPGPDATWQEREKFIRDRNAWSDSITDAANKDFDEQFRRSMRESEPKRTPKNPRARVGNAEGQWRYSKDADGYYRIWRGTDGSYYVDWDMPPRRFSPGGRSSTGPFRTREEAEGMAVRPNPAGANNAHALLVRAHLAGYAPGWGIPESSAQDWAKRIYLKYAAADPESLEDMLGRMHQKDVAMLINNWAHKSAGHGGAPIYVSRHAVQPNHAGRKRAMREFPDPYGWEPSPDGMSLLAFAKIPAKLLERGDRVSVHHSAHHNHRPLTARDFANVPVDPQQSDELVTDVTRGDSPHLVLVTFGYRTRLQLPAEQLVVIRELPVESPDARASRLRAGYSQSGARYPREERQRHR